MGVTLGEQSIITSQLRAQALEVPGGCGGETWRPTLENPCGTALVSLWRQWAYRGSFFTAERAGWPWTRSPFCRQVSWWVILLFLRGLRRRETGQEFLILRGSGFRTPD